jgi:hypothetical protein
MRPGEIGGDQANSEQDGRDEESLLSPHDSTDWIRSAGEPPFVPANCVVCLTAS